MKVRNLILFLIFPVLINAQPGFDKHFTGNSMRFDFLLAGNKNEVKVFEQQILKEPVWGGSKTRLIDPFDYGSYRFRVFDLKTDSLIFLKGFSTLFQEWQTTAEAKKMDRTFYQAAIFPYPKNKVKLSIDARQWDGKFKTIFTTEIDPANYFIRNEKAFPFESEKILDNGASDKHIDLVILAEGYTPAEKSKFYSDAKRVTGYLFEEEPFKSKKEKFNVNAVFTPSVESGTDIPGENIYKNTFLNSTFYTFDVSRYLTTSDMKSIYDASGTVACDHVYVLVNSERYGGGGFYNFVSVCTAGNQLTKEVFVHEFGHGFAGLGDEYYNSEVAYEDFYNLEIEPWEPNLTTLKDFDKKWKNMVADSVSIPTPRKMKYLNTVGVYEGGGYMSKGIFSPHIDCRMKSNEAKEFCPVCNESISKVIDFYAE